MRMFGIYNLLCDHCNLLFRGNARAGRGAQARQSSAKKVCGLAP
jgi:hypothetical protein